MYRCENLTIKFILLPLLVAARIASGGTLVLPKLLVCEPLRLPVDVQLAHSYFLHYGFVHLRLLGAY